MTSKPASLTAAEQKAASLVAKLKERERYFALEGYTPYPKQIEFHNLGGEGMIRERMLSAANQVGKTIAGGAEASMHATGLYPKWWQGKRWDRPTRGWIVGKTGLNVRDNNQEKMFGMAGVISERGTGFVPKSCVDWDKGTSLAHGYAGLYDTVQVRHVSGGVSTVQTKTYEMGREKHQGPSLDWVWQDEEGDIEIYIEDLARLTATNGIIFVTYTPRKGSTPLTKRFREASPYRALVKMSIYDAKHLTPERCKEIFDSCPEWERPARIFGDPIAGTGQVFEVAEESILEPAISTVPQHWAKLWGIDFGGSGAASDQAHPFAAALIAWDKDANCIHVLHAIRMRKSEPMQHARAMLPFGKDIPVAWPHDGNKGVPGFGKAVADLYKAEGLKMLPTHSAFSDGSINVEPGILEMDTRMKTGLFKVADHLSEWREEFRNYHRDEGEIVKVDDDLMSATRYAVMAKRFARVGNIGQMERRGGQSQMARDVDFDVFGVAA